MPVLQNPRWEAFAQARAKGKTQEEAYALAGYKPNRGAAARLSGNVRVQARLAELTERTAAKVEIDIERVLLEMARLGTSDIRKLIGPDGNIKPPSEWDDATAAAVSSIEITEKPNGDKTYKVRAWSKSQALDMIAKHLGMFIERREVTVTHISELSDDELDRRLTQILAGEMPAEAADTRH